MAWPWRRERGRHAGPASRRPAPMPVAPEPPAAAAPPVPTLAPPTVPAAEPGVRLGFDDGTEVHLSATDPRAQALRHVADVLLEGDVR